MEWPVILSLSKNTRRFLNHKKEYKYFQCSLTFFFFFFFVKTYFLYYFSFWQNCDGSWEPNLAWFLFASSGQHQASLNCDRLKRAMLALLQFSVDNTVPVQWKRTNLFMYFRSSPSFLHLTLCTFLLVKLISGSGENKIAFVTFDIDSERWLNI